MFWCYNRCSDKESYTANRCHQFYNESLTAKGLAHLKNWQWKAVVEKKAHRGRLWRMLVNDQFIQGKWEYFSLERVKAKKFMKDAERDKKEGIQGQWQRHSCQRILPGTSKEWVRTLIALPR